MDIENSLSACRQNRLSRKDHLENNLGLKNSVSIEINWNKSLGIKVDSYINYQVSRSLKDYLYIKAHLHTKINLGDRVEADLSLKDRWSYQISSYIYLKESLSSVKHNHWSLSRKNSRENRICVKNSWSGQNSVSIKSGLNN